MYICRNVHPKPLAQKFEQPLIYYIVWWIKSVGRENKTHLTQSKMLFKQDVQSDVFLKMY